MSIWNVVEKVGGFVYGVATFVIDQGVKAVDNIPEERLQRKIDKTNSDYTVAEIREKTGQWRDRNKPKD